jgi:hypothetical protein
MAREPRHPNAALIARLYAAPGWLPPVQRAMRLPAAQALAEWRAHA